MHTKDAPFVPELTLDRQLRRGVDVRGRLGQVPVRRSSGPRKRILPKVTHHARTEELCVLILTYISLHLFSGVTVTHDYLWRNCSSNRTPLHSVLHCLQVVTDTTKHLIVIQSSKPTIGKWPDVIEFKAKRMTVVIKRNSTTRQWATPEGIGTAIVCLLEEHKFSSWI